MEKMNGVLFRTLLESGCNNLNNRKKEVDALNVFPVPDGDTGTNMSLTFTNGISEVKKSGSDSLPVIAKTLSRGLLMGARGNSGVILSQIFRGFYQYIGDKEELDVKQFSEALLNGSRLAYKAVMRPVEGTILTVIRESSEAGAKWLEENPDASLESFMDQVTAQAKESLAKTPDLLPVLKEAHCVDSGGAGLTIVFEGFSAALAGKPVAAGETGEKKEGIKNEKASGYRTEFIMDIDDRHKNSINEDRFRKSLDQLGNDITLIITEDQIRLGINTMTPGEILMLAERYGSFSRIQIEPMSDHMSPTILEDKEAAPSPAKKYGLIAVAAGDGLKQLFTEYRCDYVVSGGQTMNPSTEDFVSAIQKVNAEHIFVLPNNSNIIMAAKQAAEVTEGKDIIVLETKTIPQGLSACISFNPDAEVEENKEEMEDAISHVKTGQVTYAIKDTTVDGKEIHKGEYMGLFGKDIALTTDDKVKAATELIDEMCDEDDEIITLIKGCDASKEECDEVKNYIDKHYDVDVDVKDGGQPVYSFIIGVE